MIKHEHDGMYTLLHVYSMCVIYSMFHIQVFTVAILFSLGNFIDFIGFKTSNAWYLKTSCVIELKLTRSIEWVNRSVYINFK